MFKSENVASTTLARDNGNGTKTERIYQTISERKMAERTQSSDFKPSLSYQERTVDKD
jgi:hypothetical protein